MNEGIQPLQMLLKVNYNNMVPTFALHESVGATNTNVENVEMPIMPESSLGSQNKKKEKRKTNRTLRKYSRKHATKVNIKTLNSYINTEEYNKSTPHPLILLSSSSYNKIKDNSIIVHEMTREGKKGKNINVINNTNYSIKSAGCHVKHLIDEVFGTGEIFNAKHQADVKNGYLAILCDANESLLRQDINIQYINRERNNNLENSVVLIMLFVFGKKFQDKLCNTYVWNNAEDITTVRRFKKSTVKNGGNHHFGSMGECFSFGLHNIFKTKNMITIDNYCGDDEAMIKKYRSCIGLHLKRVFTIFDTIIPGLSNDLHITGRSMLSSSKGTSLENVFMKYDNNDDNLMPHFILSSHLNVDAKTSIIHCEKDTTYTTIAVPKQIEKEA